MTSSCSVFILTKFLILCLLLIHLEERCEVEGRTAAAASWRSSRWFLVIDAEIYDLLCLHPGSQSETRMKLMDDAGFRPEIRRFCRSTAVWPSTPSSILQPYSCGCHDNRDFSSASLQNRVSEVKEEKCVDRREDRLQIELWVVLCNL